MVESLSFTAYSREAGNDTENKLLEMRF